MFHVHGNVFAAILAPTNKAPNPVSLTVLVDESFSMRSTYVSKTRFEWVKDALTHLPPSQIYSFSTHLRGPMPTINEPAGGCTDITNSIMQCKPDCNHHFMIFTDGEDDVWKLNLEYKIHDVQKHLAPFKSVTYVGFGDADPDTMLHARKLHSNTLCVKVLPQGLPELIANVVTHLQDTVEIQELVVTSDTNETKVVDTERRALRFAATILKDLQPAPPLPLEHMDLVAHELLRSFAHDPDEDYREALVAICDETVYRDHVDLFTQSSQSIQFESLAFCSQADTYMSSLPTYGIDTDQYESQFY